MWAHPPFYMAITLKKNMIPWRPRTTPPSSPTTHRDRRPTLLQWPMATSRLRTKALAPRCTLRLRSRAILRKAICLRHTTFLLPTLRTKAPAPRCTLYTLHTECHTYLHVTFGYFMYFVYPISELHDTCIPGSVTVYVISIIWLACA